MRLTPEELRARKRRNVWIALALVAFIVLVFATTVLRLQQNQAAERALKPWREWTMASRLQWCVAAAPTAAPVRVRSVKRRTKARAM